MKVLVPVVQKIIITIWKSNQWHKTVFSLTLLIDNSTYIQIKSFACKARNCYSLTSIKVDKTSHLTCKLAGNEISLNLIPSLKENLKIYKFSTDDVVFAFL